MMVDAVRLALAERFQQDLQIAAGGQGLALAHRRALIMLQALRDTFINRLEEKLRTQSA